MRQKLERKEGIKWKRSRKSQLQPIFLFLISVQHCIYMVCQIAEHRKRHDPVTPEKHLHVDRVLENH